MLTDSNFKLSDEQSELQGSLRRLLSDKVTSEYRRSRLVTAGQSDILPDSDLWQSLIDLGLFEYFAAQAERDSTGKIGEGPGIREVTLMARECGRALLPENLSDSLLALAVLAQAGFESAEPKLWQALVSGTVRVGLVPASFANAQNLQFNQAVNKVSGQLVAISAPQNVCAVLYASSESDSVLLIDLSDPNTALRESQTALDLTRPHCDINLNGAGYKVVADCSARAMHHYEQLVVASEICGAASQAFEMTLDYAKTRKQFDQPIAAFQAVQHKLADCYLALEAMQASANFGAWSADHSPEQLVIAAQSAIAFACSEGPKLIETAVQLHGGIGFTWEYDLHLYLRRVRTLAALYLPTDADVNEMLAAI